MTSSNLELHNKVFKKIDRLAEACCAYFEKDVTVHLNCETNKLIVTLTMEEQNAQH
jgi:hypothetical protein